MPVVDGAQGLELGHVAGAGAAGRLSSPGRRREQGYPREPLPLRVPLVVRVLRRQDDRLGRPPRRYRPVGHRHGQLRAARSIEGTGQAPGADTRTASRRSTTATTRPQVQRHMPVPQRRRDGHPRTTRTTAFCSKGPKGRIFVNRGKLTGKPVEDLESNPLPDDALAKLYKGKKPGNHMAQLLRVHQDREAADLRRLHAPPLDDHLPPGEHRHPPGPQAQMGPGKGSRSSATTKPASSSAREQRKGYEVVA